MAYMLPRQLCKIIWTVRKPRKRDGLYELREALRILMLANLIGTVWNKPPSKYSADFGYGHASANQEYRFLCFASSNEYRAIYGASQSANEKQCFEASE